MATATFDTLKYARSLRAAGVPEAQAEAQSAALQEALQVNIKELATKDDLKGVRDELKMAKDELTHMIKEMENRLNGRFDLQAQQMRNDQQFVRWLFGVVITMAFGILVRLFFFRNTF